MNDSNAEMPLPVQADEALHAADLDIADWVAGLPIRLAQAFGGPVDVTLQPILTRLVLRLRVCVAHLNVTFDYEIDHYIMRRGTVWQRAQLEVETMRLIERMQAFLHKEKLVEA